MLGLFVLVVFPFAARARGEARVSPLPAVNPVMNSQTMALLEAPSSGDSTIISKAVPQVAIVDNTAISTEGGDADGTTFVEPGQGGNGEISVYTVREGDTLSSIAAMFGVSSNTIVWANDLKGKTVAIGTDLVILPISGVKHVVAKGDTVASIAKKYGADQGDILSYNGLTSDEALTVGDTVIVPDGEVGAPAASGTKPSSGSKPTIKSTGTSIYPKAKGASDPYEALLVDVSKLPSLSGYFARPLASAIVTQELHGYNAVDLAAPSGTSVMAAASGRVIISKTGGYNGGYGTYIVVKHANGTQTLYAHLSKDLVKVGDTVAQGQVIGAVGMTGKTTGPHLHFEVRGAKNPFAN